MSQRSCGSGQTSVSQQTWLTQKPNSQASGWFGSQGAPSGIDVGNAVGVSVGVGLVVQSPTDPGTLHDSPGGHVVEPSGRLQQTRSSELQV